MTKIYIGNMSFGTTEEGLTNLFAEFGTVESARIIIDRESGKSKGFGFVAMADEESTKKAIDALNGTLFDGRKIRVNFAQEKGAENSRGFRG